MQADGQLDEGYSPPETYVEFELKKHLEIVNQESPCIYIMKNKQRSELDMPNLWSKMNSIRLNIEIEEIPANGEVHLISSFNPDFWLNQPKTEYEIVREAGVTHDFKSTNEVWVITRCLDGPCVGSTEAPYSEDEPGPATFKISYQKIE